MSVTDHVRAANAAFQESFPGPLTPSPRLAVAVVTCMDCRLDLPAALGLHIGDAHIIRNAGGSVTDDVLRSLAISQRLMGTREVLLVHHTTCGMSCFGFDDAFRAELTASSGKQPTWRVPGFHDVYQATREAVEQVRECVWLPHRDQVRGYVYDVSTGAVDEVS